MNTRSLKWAYTSLACVLSFVLLLAGLEKATHFEDLIAFLARLTFMPSALVAPSAIVVTSVELTLGVCLLVRPLPRGTPAAVASLFAIFLVYQSVKALPGISLSPAPCPCFGKLFPPLPTTYLIGRNVMFLGMAIGIILLGRAKEKISPKK